MLHVHRSERNISKMSIIPKLIYKFDAIPIKISPVFIVGIDKLILKCVQQQKGPRTGKIILKKKAS